jgi:hypothetical protein
MNLGMQIHDAQLDAVTVRELEQAMDDVMENLKHKRMRPVVQNKELAKIAHEDPQ